MADIRESHRRVVLAGAEIVDKVTVADLDRPTPCADWTLGDLLAHMVAQHYGFAAAAAGDDDAAGAHGAAPSVWRVRPLGDDPAVTYRAACEHVLAAFAAPGVLARRFVLPEFSIRRDFPAPMAIGFHFVDYVVHGWDVARGLGTSFEPDDEVLALAMDIAAQVPSDGRDGPDVPFGPVVPVPGDAPLLDRLLGHLGRRPSWPR